MARRIPEEHNYRTTCPAAIKAKITALENAVLALGLEGARSTDTADETTEAQFRRYCLEQTILTCIDAAVKTALDPNTKRTK